MKPGQSLFLCLSSAFLCLTLGCTKEDTQKELSPLPLTLTEYIDADWEKQILDTPGIPAETRHIKYTGEKTWIEVFARGEDVLCVRRKIYYRPDIFGPTDLKVQTIIMLILEKTTKLEVADFSPAFHRWMGQAVHDAVNGNKIDTGFDEKGFAVRLRTHGDDLILECARSITMQAFKPVAIHSQ